MHAHQDALLAGHVAADQRQVVLGVEVAGVGDGAELAELRLHAAFGHAPDELLVFHAVADELRHGDHLEAVAGAELLEAAARAPWCRLRS